jgi:hypothetical protein
MPETGGKMRHRQLFGVAGGRFPFGDVLVYMSH